MNRGKIAESEAGKAALVSVKGMWKLTRIQVIKVLLIFQNGKLSEISVFFFAW